MDTAARTMAERPGGRRTAGSYDKVDDYLVRAALTLQRE